MTCRCRTALPVIAAWLAGCATSVSVEQTFPAPLVEPLPLQMAVHYPAELAAFTYREDDAAERDWTVQLGTANVRMFTSVFTALFQQIQEVSSVPAAMQEMPSRNGTIAPMVEAFEFSLPDQMAKDQYAVWIRYNLDVYRADGQLLVRWPVTAYGQSGSGGLSAEQAMERAVVLAMRDAAATIAVDFARQPKIREALLNEEMPAQPTANPSAN